MQDSFANLNFILVWKLTQAGFYSHTCCRSKKNGSWISLLTLTHHTGQWVLGFQISIQLWSRKQFPKYRKAFIRVGAVIGQYWLPKNHASLYACSPVVPSHADSEQAYMVCFGQQTLANGIHAEALKMHLPFLMKKPRLACWRHRAQQASTDFPTCKKGQLGPVSSHPTHQMTINPSQFLEERDEPFQLSPVQVAQTWSNFYLKGPGLKSCYITRLLQLTNSSTSN